MSAALTPRCVNNSDVAALGPLYSQQSFGSLTSGSLSDGTSCTWGLVQSASDVVDPLAGVPLCLAVFSAIFVVYFISFGVGILSTSLD